MSNKKGRPVQFPSERETLTFGSVVECKIEKVTRANRESERSQAPKIYATGFRDRQLARPLIVTRSGETFVVLLLIRIPVLKRSRLVDLIMPCLGTPPGDYRESHDLNNFGRSLQSK